MQNRIVNLEKDVAVLKSEQQTMKEMISDIRESDKKQEGLLSEMAVSIAVLREDSTMRTKILKYGFSIIGAIGTIVGTIALFL
jgi:hypothetical protein